jgi:hypothetical protein
MTRGLIEGRVPQVRDLTGEAFSRFMREVYDSIHARIRRSDPAAC